MIFRSFQKKGFAAKQNKKGYIFKNIFIPVKKNLYKIFHKNLSLKYFYFCLKKSHKMFHKNFYFKNFILQTYIAI